MNFVSFILEIRRIFAKPKGRDKVLGKLKSIDNKLRQAYPEYQVGIIIAFLFLCVLGYIMIGEGIAFAVYLAGVAVISSAIAGAQTKCGIGAWTIIQ